MVIYIILYTPGANERQNGEGVSNHRLSIFIHKNFQNKEVYLSGAIDLYNQAGYTRG